MFDYFTQCNAFRHNNNNESGWLQSGNRSVCDPIVWREQNIWIYPDHAVCEILNEASSAAEKSILPIARLIPRHADAIYRVNLNVRGTQHGQNRSGNVIRIEWVTAVHLCSMEGEGRDPAPGVC